MRDLLAASESHTQKKNPTCLEVKVKYHLEGADSHLNLAGLGINVCQLLVDRHGLAVLNGSLKHFLKVLFSTVHVLQVEQSYPHVQLLLLLPGKPR